MVTFTVYRANSGGAYVEGVCLATDAKPVAGITNGSILFAVDTTDGTLTRYMFDQNSATWIETECPCSGGGSGGSSLPEVTSDDNGDVLTVVSGEWAKAAPAGNLLAHLSDDALDVSYNDVKAAAEAGRLVTLIDGDPGEYDVYYLEYYGYDDGDTEYFVRFTMMGGSHNMGFVATAATDPFQTAGG